MNLGTILAKRPNKTLYRDGERVIKVFNEDFSKPDVLNEALNTARVEETGLNVPKLLEVTKINGLWAIIYEYIDGKTMTELIAENQDLTNEFIDSMIDLQIEVHVQKCPLLTKLKDKMLRKISLTDFDSRIKYELQIRLEGMPRHNKVCHGDFRPSNIIITADGTPYIIDWSHVTQGNASADVARTYLLYLLAGQKENGEYYLNTFCEKTCTPRKYIESWLPIVAASQSVKGNKEEIEFLHRIVDVVDYV
jgi:tRNA A-37 threonylcarbamoyl transferase component Bud32